MEFSGMRYQAKALQMTANHSLSSIPVLQALVSVKFYMAFLTNVYKEHKSFPYFNVDAGKFHVFILSALLIFLSLSLNSEAKLNQR
jgi:hypothetical protein